MAQKKSKIFIYGSCVSRDAFDERYGAYSRFELVDYFARSSLATVFSHGEVSDVDFERIESNFQRRMVQSDVRHGLIAMLSEQTFDAVLIDLIDERFSVFADEYGARCTLSGELLSSGFNPRSRRGVVVQSMTDEFFELWEKGWDSLVRSMAAASNLSKLFINQVYWSHACEQGVNYMPAYPAIEVERANAMLSRMYARMREDLSESQFLRFNDAQLTGSSDHRWGRSPFHYVDEYYVSLLDNLEQAIASLHARPGTESDAAGSDIGAVTYGWERLVPARNRLLHGRPSPLGTVNRIDRIVVNKTSIFEVSMHAADGGVVTVSATVEGDLQGRNNLLLVVDGEQLVEEDMQALGYMKSWIGYFQYLKNYIRDGRLEAKFKTSAKTALFRIMPWNFDGPIVLEDLRIGSDSVKFEHPSFESVHALDDRGTSVPIVREPGIKANFLLATHRCGPQCVAHCDKWFASIDGFADRHDSVGYGRRPVFVEGSRGELIPASSQRRAPAFLIVPQTIDAYKFRIGDKSRNMLRKAQRMGYEFIDAGPEGYGQDIHEIRTSDPMRQGRPIPQYYYSNPPIYVMTPSPVGCPYHTERFFGIFKDGRLVSYITLFMFGEFGQINHILCHKEHVKHGVMNLNVFHMIDQIISRYSWVKSINYLYVSEHGAGIDLFKRGVGFEPESFLVYDSELEAADPMPPVHESSTQPACRDKTPTVRVKIEKRDFVRAAVTRATLDASVDDIVGREWVTLAPSAHAFPEFCSKTLPELAGEHAVGTCFVVPFPGRASAAVYPDVARYLSRRFKGNPVPNEGFVDGFKGGQFRALAFFDIEDYDDTLFDGALILEKLK